MVLSRSKLELAMVPVSIIISLLCALTTVTEAARKRAARGAVSVDSEDLSTLAAPICGSSNPEPKDYYFDLPGETVDNSAAVRMIRNPEDPWLEVTNGAVWNVKGDADDNGKIIPASILFEARDKFGQQNRPQQYNLKNDMVYMKKRVENGVMWIEIKLKGCEGGKGPGPVRPERPSTAAPFETAKGRDHRKSRGADGKHGRGNDKGGRKGNGRSSVDRRTSLLEEGSNNSSGDDWAVDDDGAALTELHEEELAELSYAEADDDAAVLFEISEDAMERHNPTKERRGSREHRHGTKERRGSREHGHGNKANRDRGDRDAHARASGVTAPRGDRGGRGDKSDRDTRGDKGDKGDRKGPERRMPQPEPIRPARPTGQENCEPLTFAQGTFYPQSAIKKALQMEVQKGKDGGWIAPSETAKNVSIAPSLGKGIFGALGFSTLGAMAVFPVVWMGQEGGLAAGPIGALVGGLTSGAVAMYKNWKTRPRTASEKLYEKMYCLTKVKTCNGEACFKHCHDEDGNEVIVPMHSEPGEGIRC